MSGIFEASLEPNMVAESAEIYGNLASSARAKITEPLVDDLMQDIPGDPCITACCNCVPPHAIYIRQSVLVKAEILCESCLQPYRETLAG